MATHEGWSNYETWAVKLWIDNEEPSHRHWCDAADQALRDGPQSIAGTSIMREPSDLLAERLESELEESMPELEGVWADLLRAAFGDVDWHEIAESMLGNARERAGTDAAGEAT